MKVLNVGGNVKDISLPDVYKDWEKIFLDIDPAVNPDIVCDARNMFGIKEKFDAIYCSHTLEHFHPHEIPEVLKGFNQVLKEKGFVHIRVPDLMEVIKLVIGKQLDFDEILYQSVAGPITPQDVIYGFQKEIKESGHDYFSHKIAYSVPLLEKLLNNNGFPFVNMWQGNLEIIAIASKKKLKDNPFV